LAPALLPAAHVVALYRRRWDIESAFKLLKSHLHLFHWWSGHQRVVRLQVFATFLLAQVLLGMRDEFAERTAVDVRDSSLPLLWRWLPELAAAG
jgi:IS4 transposase